MSKRIQSVIVDDIIGFIDKIGDYTAGLSFAEFAVRPMVVDACMHNIEVIGEAINKLGEDTRQKADTIPWSLITGMKARLLTDSLEPDPEVVWHVLQSALPEFKGKLERLHRRLIARNL